MVQTSTHGGSCCGMRHIWQFREETTEQYIQGLIREMDRGNFTKLADERLQLEVILSDKQTRDNPALVDALARLGYVYTSSWTGGHGTPVHLFLRAKRRLALSAANFYDRWTGNNGMLPHPDLAGELPRFEEGNTQREDQVGGRTRDRNNLAVGDRVRINSPGSRFNGQESVISRFSGYRWDGYRGVLNLRTETGRHVEIRVTNLVRIFEQPVQEPAPVREPIVYRHPVNPAGWPAPAALQVLARRLILSQFYCVFRNTGQASRVFSTLLEGQAAYPNARDWHERKIFSDGEIVEGRVNHG